MRGASNIKAILKRPLAIAVLGFVIIVIPTFAVLLWSFTQPSGSALSSSIREFQNSREKTTFALRTQDGKVFSKKDIYRHYVLAVFGDTSCARPCSDHLKAITGVSNSFKGGIQTLIPLFISTNPKHDTQAVLKAFVKPYSPKLVALTGRQSEINRAMRFLRAQEPVEAGIYLMGPGHKWLGVYTGEASQQKLLDWMRSYMTD